MAVLDEMPTRPTLADQKGRGGLEDRDQRGLGPVERPNPLVGPSASRRAAGSPSSHSPIKRARSAATDSTPIAPKSTRPLVGRPQTENAPDGHREGQAEPGSNGPTRG